MGNNHITALQSVLADTYVLYLKTQNYHWNVEGRHFSQLHLLFEGQYNELFAANDEIAERIRTLGDKVDGSFSGFSKRATIKEGDYKLDENSMVKDLFESNEQVISNIKKALESAEKEKDHVTVDLLVRRAAAHEKAAWMLRSSLPKDDRVQVPAAAKYA